MKRCAFWMAAAFLAALLGPASQPAWAAKIVVAMPTSPPNVIHLPVLYAIDKGIYKKHGIEVEVKYFRGGVAVQRAAVSAQSGVDAGNIPGALAMSGIAGGSGHKFFHSFAHLNEAQAATAPDIDTPAKLKGRMIGIEGRGGYSHLGILRVLEMAGLKDEDVKYIVTAPPARVPYLVEGKADAVVIHVEQVFMARQKKPDIKVIANLWKADPLQLYAAMTASEEKLKSRKNEFVAFAASLMEATRAIYKDKAGLRQTAIKHSFPAFKKNPEIFDQTYDILVKERLWTVNNGMPRKVMEATNELNVRLKKYKGAPPKYEDMMAFDVMEAALKKVGEAAPNNEK
ncbi:MAG: ABC transporter substrate-binding protein [Candidatus Tectomicrobia bacterium]|uniref:ABC transporter substrate-binding protein n=1 Tax=Tectimicrobiota bacterium TaxID=2528274 RepID=A0A932I188_UNCTE|nr:ABC transporter substrate-binding protein [Candidatus Tectomicrobia bacterium]